jgi:secreted trypsin-like serine protease
MTRAPFIAASVSLLAGAALAASAQPQVTPRAGAEVIPPALDELGQKPMSATIKDLRDLPVNQRDAVAAALRLSPRVVGGTRTTISEHPWQVALIRAATAEPRRDQFCGGALIAPDVVVTAAHCVDNPTVRLDAGRLDVVAGTTTYQTGGERLDVMSIFVHPQWNSTTMDNDIAVLKLNGRSRLGRPVALSTQTVQPGAQVTVTGWGATAEGASGSRNLLMASFPVVDTATCNQPESYAGSITDRMMCAGTRDGGIDSCQGDSGGPLTLGTGPNAPLVGVVSWGEGCARRLKYGVYARLSALGPWVQSLLASERPPAEQPALR